MGPEQDSLKTTPLKDDTRSSSEIKGDIRQTRDRLDNTLETLNQRLSPRSLVNDVLSWIEGHGTSQTSGGSSDSLQRGYQNVVRQIKKNPMPALLIGAGITWIILGPENDASQGTERSFEEPPAPKLPRLGESESVSVEQVGESGIPSVVKEKVRDAKEALSSGMEAVTAKVSEIGGGVQAQAKSAGSAIGQGFRQSQRAGSGASQQLQRSTVQAGDKFQEMVEDYPFAVAVGFLGVGVLTGLLLPRTRQEDQLVGEKSDQLIEQIKETGKEGLEKAKTVAQRITQTTVEEAERQGITSEAAGSKISEIAGKIGAIATEAKQEALRATEELKPAADPERPAKKSPRRSFDK
jgi:ElaB/YqjD/DUF883 family membrane-anchored ribosome-binding protein